MISEKTGERFLPCPSAGNCPVFFLQTNCDYGFGLSVVLMWWTRCQHDWRLRQCLSGFIKTNSHLCPLNTFCVIWETVTIQVTLMKFSWVIRRDSPFSYLFPHLIIYPMAWNESSIFLYLFILQLKFWSPGTLLAPGPCGFELLTNFPTLWKALGGSSGSILYTLLVLGLESTRGTEEKLETQCLNNRHVFECQRVGLNSKNLKKK